MMQTTRNRRYALHPCLGQLSTLVAHSVVDDPLSLWVLVSQFLKDIAIGTRLTGISEHLGLPAILLDEAFGYLRALSLERVILDPHGSRMDLDALEFVVLKPRLSSTLGWELGSRSPT